LHSHLLFQQCAKCCFRWPWARLWQEHAVGANGVTHLHAATIPMEEVVPFVAMTESPSVRTMLIVTTLRLQHQHQRRVLLQHLRPALLLSQLHLLRLHPLQHLRNQCRLLHPRRVVLVVWSCLDTWKIGARPSSGGTRTCQDIA
jgi:hypothetical protein